MSDYEPPARKRLREAREKATAEREAAERAAAMSPDTPAMTDERLAQFERDNRPLGDHNSGFTADEVDELIDELKRARRWGAAAHVDLEALQGLYKALSERADRLSRALDGERAAWHQLDAEATQLRAQLAERDERLADIGETEQHLAKLRQAKLPEHYIRLYEVMRREGGDWSPARTRDQLVALGRNVTSARAHQVMKSLAAKGYLEQVRPRAYTYRLKTTPGIEQEADRG